jgi:hypothetical protein
MAIKAGEQIDYECNYQNDGTTTVIQGLSAVTNEMCVFVGAYYPRDEKFETCGTTGQFADQGTAATYIGTGTATCGATLSCLQSAAQSTDLTRFLRLHGRQLRGRGGAAHQVHRLLVQRPAGRLRHGGLREPDQRMHLRDVHAIAR